MGDRRRERGEGCGDMDVKMRPGGRNQRGDEGMKAGLMMEKQQICK